MDFDFDKLATEFEKDKKDNLSEVIFLGKEGAIRRVILGEDDDEYMWVSSPLRGSR